MLYIRLGARIVVLTSIELAEDTPEGQEAMRWPQSILWLQPPPKNRMAKKVVKIFVEGAKWSLVL
jgi:hypothetical protein